MGNGASPWSVKKGGTRRDSLTAHGVLIGQGSYPVNSAVLGDGQILVGQDGADPQAKTVSGDATIDASGVVKLFPSAARRAGLSPRQARLARSGPRTAPAPIRLIRTQRAPVAAYLIPTAATSFWIASMRRSLSPLRSGG